MLPEGIAVARVTDGENGSLPQLEQCDFLPTESADQRSAQLEQLVEQYKLDRSHCISVMPGRDFNLLLVEAPQVDSSELKAAVRWQIKDLIDFHIDDAVIDVFDIPGQEQRGRQKLMYVVASRISSVQDHIDLLEKAGAALSVIDIPELALRNVATLLPEDQNGVALLQLTRYGGLLTLSRQGDLFLSRTFDTGTRVLLAQQESATVAEPEEEGMSLEPEEESYGGMPAGLVRLLDNIVLEVQRSLDYYESHFSLPPISGLVVAPTEEPINGLLGYLAGNLSVPVRMLDLNLLLEHEGSLGDTLQAQSLLAIGAALRREAKVL